MASKRLKAFNSKEGEDAKMDMSPMIDMVFLLLVFFIVVSTPMVVQLDPVVEPAVAYNAKEPEDKRGRIVVNVRKDGSIYPVNFEEGELKTEEDISNYVREQKEGFNDDRYDVRLHLRGDKEAVFKYSRKVIRAAATVGVNNVVFAAYNFEN
jgi:biopolymer transport protein ExbD